MAGFFNRFTTATVVLLVLSLALAACGDSADDASSDDTNPGAQPVATSDMEDVPATEPDAAMSDDDPGDMPGDATIPEPAGPTEAMSDEEAEPADPAPEFGSIDSWHNSEPLTLAGLRGSPVLLVFWADF